jgi:hypothetical protein
LYVDGEACNLWEVRRGGEVEYVHVVKDVVSVEPAEEEEPRIGEERGVIAPWRGSLSERRARLILQGHCSFTHGIDMKVGVDRGIKKLTEIKEEQFGGILGAVVPARNVKIGTYLCRRMR